MDTLQQHIADICATAAGVKVEPRGTADVINLASYSASNQPTEDDKRLANDALKTFVNDFAKLNESAHALSVDAAKAGQKDVSDTVGMILLDFMFIEARLEKLGAR